MYGKTYGIAHHFSTRKKMKNLIMPEIAGRYSPVIFSEKQISDEHLKLLLFAASLAPSCFNEQPWRFYYAGKREQVKWRDLFELLEPGNREWAHTADVLMVSLAKKTFSRNGKPNRFALYDTGMAVSQMIIQGMKLGIYVHQMGGFDMAAARKYLKPGDDFELISFLAMGYEGDKTMLNDTLKIRADKPSSRMPPDKLIIDF